ncbi:hypothetical protein AX768_04125 [Burkholderia sp. PAMC 28687]|nr:hypothetical protein AX768_04125 [Burkholderia sp. PAMC 28687]
MNRWPSYRINSVVILIILSWQRSYANALFRACISIRDGGAGGALNGCLRQGLGSDARIESTRQKTDFGDK